MRSQDHGYLPQRISFLVFASAKRGRVDLSIFEGVALCVRGPLTEQHAEMRKVIWETNGEQVGSALEEHAIH